MKKEIILLDNSGNEQYTTVYKYLLRFDSGASISLDLNDKWLSIGVVCRAWYGEKEWEPSMDGSCSLILNPSSGNSIWVKPLVLTGTSLADAKIKATAKKLPQIFSVVDAREQLLPPAVQKIIVKDLPTGIAIQIQLPQADISSVFQESLHIIIKQRALVCEPKGANLWVIKPLVK